MHCFPESWDGPAGRAEDNDYRNSKPYQMILGRCAGTNYNRHVVTSPRHQFFGTIHHWAPKRNGYGTQSINIFINTEDSNRENPRISDAYIARGILISKELPVELDVKIMLYAHYEASRRLTVPNDPFHPSNREEIVKYLNYCWELLVCCKMTAHLCQNREWSYWNTIYWHE